MKKHLSNHKELKFKEILKHQCQAAADFDAKKVLIFLTIDEISYISSILKAKKIVLKFSWHQKFLFQIINKNVINFYTSKLN